MIIRVNIRRRRELVYVGLIGGRGACVVLAGEIAVRTAQQGVRPRIRILTLDVSVEPLSRSGIIALLEVSVSYSVRYEFPFLTAVQSRKIIEISVDFQGLGICFRLEVGFRESVTAELVEPVALAALR